MSVLTSDQKKQFEELGYVLVSGLVPEEISLAAEATIWRELGASPDDRETWKDLQATRGFQNPEVVAMFTPAMREAVAEISGDSLEEIVLPKGAFALNIFPNASEWRHHGPHIDHAIQRDGYHVFPPPMRMASLIYINPVEPFGAPTVVWPGSHKKIEALAKSDPDKYELMWVLNNDLNMLDLGEGIRVPGGGGDVLFYHYLCAHSGSNNAGSTPRFALAHKW